MATEKNVIAKECRFAIHMPTKRSDIPDFHLVKEILHFEDGSTKPNIKFERDFKRTFYVTKKNARNHEQKKEEESLENLVRYECTQSDLTHAVARALGKPWSSAGLRQLAESPYLYGSDISSTALIKQQYAAKWPDAISPFTIAYFDIETDVLHGTNDPIMATIVFKDQIFTVILASAIKGYSSVTDRLNALANKHLSKYIEKNNFKIEFRIVETPVELITLSIGKAHEWSPDFLAIWNMDFDIPRIIQTLEKYGVNPKDVFSDPKISPELRFCKYKKGSTKKVTASGAVKPKNPSEQWHSLYCPAGFYVIDAMCTYRFVRQGEQELPYYSLDFVLNLQLGVRKLNFAEADSVEDGTLDWHVFMQERYPLEYAIYNIFDCVGMYELEEKVHDLSQSLPVQSGFTDFARFNSQTKKFADKYHFFVQKYGRVAGTIAPVEKKDDLSEEDLEVDENAEEEEKDEFDELTDKQGVLSLKAWIVTLPSHLSSIGRPLVRESRTIFTMIRTHAYDSDAVSAYPSCTSVGNVSRATTKREIIDIIGIEENDFRRNNMNLMTGHVNALEYGCQMHKLPTPQHSLCFFDDL